MREKIKPIVFINNIDIDIFDDKSEGEKMYQKFQKHIDDINNIISSYETEDIGDTFRIDPFSSNVAFGSTKF